MKEEEEIPFPLQCRVERPTQLRVILCLSGAHKSSWHREAATLYSTFFE